MRNLPTLFQSMIWSWRYCKFSSFLPGLLFLSRGLLGQTFSNFSYFSRCLKHPMTGGCFLFSLDERMVSHWILISITALGVFGLISEFRSLLSFHLKMCFGPCELPVTTSSAELWLGFAKPWTWLLDCDDAEIVEFENPSCIASRILIVLNNIILSLELCLNLSSVSMHIMPFNF